MKDCPICAWGGGFHDPTLHGWRRHTWGSPLGIIVWPHCYTCGMIRRADGGGDHCRGPVSMELRDPSEHYIDLTLHRELS